LAVLPREEPPPWAHGFVTVFWATQLIVGARYLALCVLSEYKYNSVKTLQTSRDFDAAGDQLNAVYASGRLALPFEGVLLVGY
jgi:hypothetical protein